MSDFASPSPDNIVAAVNSSHLNAFILEAFLCGLHCVVFTDVAWRLLYQKNWMLVAFLAIQWMISIVVLALDWFVINVAYLRRGNTSDDTTQTLTYLPFYTGKIPVVEWTFVTITLLLCNGFLIWRCYFLSGRNLVLVVILCTVFVASIVLGFIAAFPSKKMQDDTLLASLYLAFFASSAAIALIVSSSIVRWTTRGKRLTFQNFLLALVDGAVFFSEVLMTLVFLAVLSLPSVYDSGHIRKLLVYELNVYLQYPLPPLAGLTTALISLRIARKQGQPASAQEFSDPSYTRMTVTRTILVPKGEE